MNFAIKTYPSTDLITTDISLVRSNYKLVRTKLSRLVRTK
jgi:hypothetical protein